MECNLTPSFFFARGIYEEDIGRHISVGILVVISDGAKGCQRTGCSAGLPFEDGQPYSYGPGNGRCGRTWR